MSLFSFNLPLHENSTHGLTHTCTDIWHCSWLLCRHTYTCCHMIMLRNITCDHMYSQVRNMIESYTYVNTHAHDMRWHLEMACMRPYVHSQKCYICTYKCIQWYNWTWKCPTCEHKWAWKCPTCEHKCSSWHRHMMVLQLSAYEYTHTDCVLKNVSCMNTHAYAYILFIAHGNAHVWAHMHSFTCDCAQKLQI